MSYTVTVKEKLTQMNIFKCVHKYKYIAVIWVDMQFWNSY